ncbi:MAG: DinB family protein [Chitinophagaceae bacterium]
MKKIFAILFCFSSINIMAQKDSTPTLKSILLEQLKTTHNVKDWFVPASLAIDSLTPEQANWQDAKGNHSIGQLTEHLIFWDERSLMKFRGEKVLPFNGNNNETFTKFDKNSWNATVKKLDDVLTQWEKEIANADDAKLMKWYSTIAHISTHNAYHIGQIIYIRKTNGWWNPDNGVK